MTAWVARRAHLVVLAAGGTGGHVFPAEALALELAGRGLHLAVVTDRRGGEIDGPFETIETYRVRAGGIAGKSLGDRLKSGPELAIGTLQAHRLLRRLRPEVVVGFGGYASVPTMIAATFGGYRTAIHEQNAILGRANRRLAGRVERVATSFEHSEGIPVGAHDKVVHTGMPVRAAVTAVRERPYPLIDGDTPIELLVIGGSQGARVFADVMPAALGKLEDAVRVRLRVSQQCRPEDLDRARAAYEGLQIAAELAPFFDDIPDRLGRAHLIVARAGASTIAEVTAVGRPSVLVPYPFGIDDHQSFNAHAVDEAGAGWLLPEDAFTPEGVAERLRSLFGLPAILETAAASARAAGRPDAARRLADLVMGMLPSNGETDTGRKAA